MIDTILVFLDETAARSSLPGYRTTEGWNEARVIAPLSIVTDEAVYDNAEPRQLVTPEVTLPGYWVAVALRNSDTERRVALAAMDECMLVADRSAANRGEQFILYMGLSADPQVVATARVAPVFAGSRYPFGA